jgi:hypothetical protein
MADEKDNKHASEDDKKTGHEGKDINPKDFENK